MLALWISRRIAFWSMGFLYQGMTTDRIEWVDLKLAEDLVVTLEWCE